MKTLYSWLLPLLLSFSQFANAQWVSQGPPFIGTGGHGQHRLGQDMALSYDGNTVLATYIGNGNKSGFITYKWSGAQWQQTNVTDVFDQNFVASLAISGDGLTVAASMPTGFKDTIVIYTYASGQWHYQSTINVLGPFSNVTLSANGNTLSHGNRVYIRQGASWSLQAVLQPNDKPTADITVCDTVNRFSCRATSGISADGNTVIIGDYYAADTATNVWVFTRSGTVWTQQGSRLEGTGTNGTAQFYALSKVHISGDGNTLGIGAAHAGFNDVGIWIFKRQNGVWTEQSNGALRDTLNLTTYPFNAIDHTQGDYFSLSYDGSRLVTDDRNGFGFLHWQRTGNNWARIGTLPHYNLASIYDSVEYVTGYLPVLDSSGTRVAAGMNGYKTLNGAVSFFNLATNTWVQNGSAILADGLEGGTVHGTSVAISKNGNAMAEWGSYDEGTGAVWVFLRNGTQWHQAGQKIIPGGWHRSSGQSDGTNHLVALSANGNVLAIGVASANWFPSPGTVPRGTVYFYTRNNNVYTLRDSIVGPPNSYVGVGIRLSDDGNTLITFGDSVGIYYYNGSAWSQQFSCSCGSNMGLNLPSIGLSGDGNTAVIGMTSMHNSKGAMSIFHRTGSTWVSQADSIAPHLYQGDAFPTDVSLSENGNVLAAGTPAHFGQGQVYIYRRSGSTWALSDSVLTFAGAHDGAYVSLSSTGDSLAEVSAFQSNPVFGVWIYNGGNWQVQAQPLSDNATCCWGVDQSLAASGDLKYIVIGYPQFTPYYSGVQIFSPSAMNITGHITNSTCAETADGKIVLNINGGGGPISFAWSNNAPNADSAVNLLPGIYSVTASNAGGDTLIRQYTVSTQNSRPGITYATTFNCSNNTGTIQLILAGGTPPFTYAWSTIPVQNTDTATGLQGGWYNFTLMDSAGCAYTDSAWLPAANGLTGYTSHTDAGCLNNNGSAVITITGGTAPYTFVWSNSALGDSIGGLQAGTYVVTVTDAANCLITDSTVVDANCIFEIQGRVFYDRNNNCLFDGNEHAASGYTMRATSGSTIVYGSTDNAGNYNIDVPLAGVYKVEIATAQLCNYPLCSDSTAPVQVYVDSFVSPVTNVNLPLVNPGIDLMLTVNTFGPFPGNTFDYTIYYGNLQDSIVPSSVVTVVYDSKFHVNYTNPPYSSLDIVNHIITWNVNNIHSIYPLGNQQLTVNFTTDTGIAPNTNLQLHNSITPPNNDCNITNNTVNLGFLIMPPMDPNYKVSYPADILLIGDSVITYTVHFQNTGAGPTHFVEIRDTLESNLDPASVVTLATSHMPYTFTVQGENILKWKFDPCMLVDSSVSQELSQGFVTFRVRTKSLLGLGTTINNTASIYFDYNEPVQTNTANNVVSNPVGIVFVNKDLLLQLAPNPANTFINVTTGAEASGSTLQVLDALGQQVASYKVTSQQLSIYTGILPVGMYIVKLSNGEGRQATARFVVER